MISSKLTFQTLLRNDLTGQADTHGPAFAQGFVAAGYKLILSSGFQAHFQGA